MVGVEWGWGFQKRGSDILSCDNISRAYDHINKQSTFYRSS